jgi:hypothetical protein
MANEATITTTLKVVKGNINYQSLPASYQGTVTGTAGPVPGAKSIATTSTGTAISFSPLTTAGYCRFQNLDGTNYVEVGIMTGGAFYPLFELLAGQSAVMRMSRNVGSTLGARANTAAVVLVVEAFET